MLEIAEVLGIDLGTGGLDDLTRALLEVAHRYGVGEGSAEQMMEQLLAIRTDSRQARDWATADAIRDDLAQIDIVIEDSADGTRWYRR